MAVVIKSEEELETLRQAGKIVARLLEKLSRAVRPGLKTRELDRMVAEEVARLGVRATFKGYRGFPAHLCVSINDEVVHGIPGERRLKEGDIVSLDLGITVSGLIADAAVTVGVGQISPEAQRLLETTYNALWEGIAQCKEGKRVGDISYAIQQYVESRGFSVVREYAGHGVGRQLHEDPQVPNFGLPGQGPLLLRGLTLALEPMVNAGGWATKLAPNGWTVLTADGSLSAHFEHTVVITDGEAEVLTML